MKSEDRSRDASATKQILQRCGRRFAGRSLAQRVRYSAGHDRLRAVGPVTDPASTTELGSQLPNGTVEWRSASKNADPHTDTLARMVVCWGAVRSTPDRAPVGSAESSP